MPSKIHMKAYEAKIRRLQRKLDKTVERMHVEAEDSRRRKEHAHEVLTSYLGKIRRQDETLAANNVEIQELRDQVAVQYKKLAEARSDVERATKLAMDAAAQHNRLVQQLHDARKQTDEMEVALALKSRALQDAQLTIPYRIWSWIAETARRAKLRSVSA
jgi:hypothetical protein